ncbi:MAG: glycine--tRNA ligase subunit beta [Pseudohongiellaceae bacterium]|nr:glycine--tRNA ligase subunit beta [Pseudohongiellaceae bacterium]
MATKDFLVEIGTGELPPKALKQLSTAFSNGIKSSLQKANLSFDSLQSFASPRRLAVRINKLQTKQEDKSVERFGPAVAAAYDKDGKPSPAANGFARSCSVALEELEQLEKDGVLKLAYRSVVKGQDTSELLADIVTSSLAALPIPKKMRWGSSRDEFVRPVHWVVMLFGTDVIPATILGIASGRESRGHRSMSNTAITFDSPDQYEEKLITGKVIADYAQRKDTIKSQIEELSKSLEANIVIDEDLLEEVTSLVEWPVALAGKFDEHFLTVPREALISSMKSHQKCFYVLDKNDELLPYFVTISNIESKDPQQVISGNERVIRPRLADAKFFFDTDKKQTLDSRTQKLGTIVFQKELGTVLEKSERVAKLAKFLANKLSANEQWCERAAILSKCDLVTDMVSEFAELQGIVGYYYALNDKEPEEVALALNEQYMPRFSGDALPSTMTGNLLAIADKLDTIVGLFAIGQPPTGSKDPFALRRAALGVLRIIVEKGLEIDLLETIEFAGQNFNGMELKPETKAQVFDFLLDRFKAWYQAEGVSAEVFQSVYALKPSKPYDFDLRIKAVNSFSALNEAQSLASSNKRVSNILQKEKGASTTLSVDPSLFSEEAEKALAQEVERQTSLVGPLFEAKDYTKGLEALASSKDSIDKFFDEVLVMAEDPAVRANRIALLAQLRNLFLGAADISYLSRS